ncbi:MAG TPA: fluoride efflux transporter CrcB [Vulgatibacter sp.]
MSDAARLLWICLGGALGTGARHLVGVWAGSRLGASFPFGTLIVNLSGSFLIGFVSAIALGVASFPPALRLVLTTGFLGGYTTYSSFNHETLRLFEEGARAAAALNLGVTVVGGLIAGLLGLALGRALI